jgi:hypothetical protein
LPTVSDIAEAEKRLKEMIAANKTILIFMK